MACVGKFEGPIDDEVIEYSLNEYLHAVGRSNYVDRVGVYIDPRQSTLVICNVLRTDCSERKDGLKERALRTALIGFQQALYPDVVLKVRTLNEPNFTNLKSTNLIAKNLKWVRF